jgi:hypothetical protein
MATVTQQGLRGRPARKLPMDMISTTVPAKNQQTQQGLPV